jgi:Transposase Tn5 dimerisation domain
VKELFATYLIAVFCILSWRVFWMTMVQRTAPAITAGAAITSQEQTVLDKLFGSPAEKDDNLSTYLIRIARLGGYLARTNDAAPGNTVMWRGLCRLTDIQLGFLLAKGDVGN